MTQEQEDNFIYNIYTVVQDNPHLSERAINAITSGMNKALDKLHRRATDMEVLAVAMHSTMNQRYKKSTQEYIDRLVKSKVEANLDNSLTANLESLIQGKR